MSTSDPIENVELDQNFKVVFDHIKNIPVDPNDLEAQKRYYPLNMPHLAPDYVMTKGDEREEEIARKSMTRVQKGYR
jgi:hypothetical protein